MKKILIIDDDEEYCLELTHVIHAEGFEVEVAHDGIAGKSLIENGRYQLIILDLKLPGLSGYEVLRSIRRSQSPVKILVVSGRPLGETLLEQNTFSKEEEEKILKMADAVMSKPFKVDEFLKKVNALAGEV
jgi:DNA-binding response OmpR family regulator